MLACVCQPADPGLFRRSPIPLGAPPLKFNQKGAIPKPGRTFRIPVITNEPCSVNKSVIATNKQQKVVQKTKKKTLNDNVVSNNVVSVEKSSAIIINSKKEHGGKGEEKELIGSVTETDRRKLEEITVVDTKKSPVANLKSADKEPIRKLNDFKKV